MARMTMTTFLPLNFEWRQRSFSLSWTKTIMQQLRCVSIQDAHPAVCGKLACAAVRCLKAVKHHSPRTLADLP